MIKSNEKGLNLTQIANALMMSLTSPNLFQIVTSFTFKLLVASSAFGRIEYFSFLMNFYNLLVWSSRSWNGWKRRRRNVSSATSSASESQAKGETWKFWRFSFSFVFLVIKQLHNKPLCCLNVLFFFAN